ncbi:MAG: hypothetical protein WBL53_10985 [Pseudonocardiaceae bacterium]
MEPILAPRTVSVNRRFTANSPILALPPPRIPHPIEGADSHYLPRTRKMMMAQHDRVSGTAITANAQPLGPAVDTFLTERDLAPSTHRVYALDLHVS